jgi:4-amino-4-deoxy-L-arabinose transferase-like glycosyltransferase
LPLGIALSTLAWDRGFGRWRQFAPALGPLLFAGVLGAWVVLTEVAGPAEYSIWGALREHFIDRGIHGMHHKQPFWYFLERLPQSLLPWTGLVPGALVLAWRRRTAADRLVFAAALFVFFFFLISTEKRELYALPSLPAFALMAAALAAAVGGWDDQHPAAAQIRARWLYVGHGMIAALIAVVGIAVPFAAERFDEVSAALVLPLAAALVVTGCATLFFCWRARLTSAVVAPALGVGLLYLLTVTTVYPEMEEQKSARPFTLLIQEATAASREAGHRVLCYHLDNLPEHFAFHGNGFYTAETYDPGELARHLSQEAEVFAVVHGGELEPLAEDLTARLWLVAEARLARRDVLLVANFPYSDARPLGAALAGCGVD